MDGKMKVAIMTGIKKMEFTECDIPKPNDNEVLIKVENVGVCGSDLHYFEHGRIGNFIVEPPFILGHEAGGIIVEVGNNVTQLKPGDKVALEPGKTCGHCEFCKSGKYNLCPDVKFFATPPINGVFQEYVCHEADLCFKLPDNVGTMAGALVEPLSVGFHAAVLGGAMIGQTAVVMGAGCIGLVTVLALKAMGVSKVYVVDIIDKRLQKALELGADVVINGINANAVECIMDLTQGCGGDLVIETAGSEITTQQAIQVAKKGATIVCVGYHAKEKINFPMNMAIDKELIVKTIFRYRNIYPLAIQAISSGKVRIENIVTNIYTLDEIQEAMNDSIEHKEEIVKSVIKFC